MTAKEERKVKLLAQQLEVAQKAAGIRAKLAELAESEKKLVNGRKILWGAALMDEAEKNPKFAAWALKKAEEYFVRPIDKQRIEPDLKLFRLKAETLESAKAEKVAVGVEVAV